MANRFDGKQESKLEVEVYTVSSYICSNEYHLKCLHHWETMVLPLYLSSYHLISHFIVSYQLLSLQHFTLILISVSLNNFKSAAKIIALLFPNIL